jgi:hypothetical protein
MYGYFKQLYLNARARLAQQEQQPVAPLSAKSEAPNLPVK